MSNSDARLWERVDNTGSICMHKCIHTHAHTLPPPHSILSAIISQSPSSLLTKAQSEEVNASISNQISVSCTPSLSLPPSLSLSPHLCYHSFAVWGVNGTRLICVWRWECFITLLVRACQDFTFFFVQNYRMCVYCSKQVRGYKMKHNIGLRLLLTAGFKVISQLTNGGWLDVSAV